MPPLRKHFLIWLPLIVSMSTALAMLVLSNVASHWARDLLGGKPLPGLTILYYYHPYPYFFLIPLFVWAIIIAFRKKYDVSHATLFAVVTLSTSLISLAFCLIANALPFIPMVGPMSN